MLMQAKNAVGSNTPGAASSAADFELIWEAKIQPKPSPNELFEDKIEEVSKRDIEANLKKNSSD